jgi:hypothetical protein
MNAHYKEHPDITANYYRFRQKEPSNKADYRTVDFGKHGTKAVIEKPVIGGNPDTWSPKPLGADPATWTPAYLR